MKIDYDKFFKLASPISCQEYDQETVNSVRARFTGAPQMEMSLLMGMGAGGNYIDGVEMGLFMALAILELMETEHYDIILRITEKSFAEAKAKKMAQISKEREGKQLN
jgi:hypothetical protein